MGLGSGKTNNSPNARSHLHESLKPLRIPVLKGTKLIDHNHIKLKGNLALLDKPLDILPIDDINIGISFQGFQSFLFASDRYAVSKVRQMIPFLYFVTPGYFCYPKRCYD